MPRIDPASSIVGGITVKKSTPLSTSLSQQRLLSPVHGALDVKVKFPRIDECAHFHYESVECGRLKLVLLERPPSSSQSSGACDLEKPEQVFWVTVNCKGKDWVIRRMVGQFKSLDKLLHECIFDRTFTQLRHLNDVCDINDDKELHVILKKYIARLSELPVEQMSCAPLLHWFGMDNKGTKLVATLRETSDINIPAIAAAHAIRRYMAQSSHELSLEVGDMVSIIDLTDPNWWRGKCRLQVGSFPAQCVRKITDAKCSDEVNQSSSPSPASQPCLNTCETKPIVKKHGRFMEFLRSFVVTRPTKSRLKQKGILKERVFGCDLGEYLHNCGDDVPIVVRDCLEFVEKYGIVDGIYRISGIASHVRGLRHDYDCERRPKLSEDPDAKGEESPCDPHSVAGLCKLYFRELPNPLLTYQLYDRFAVAINAPEDERLLKIHDVIQQLPPPHYRTLRHLALHLQIMSRHSDVTSMHCRNLAIVWAPNLLRSRDLEAGTAAFTEARVQSVVIEFLIANADTIFSDQLQNMQLSRGQQPLRPKSLMVFSGPKLISLEEAQARSKAGSGFLKPSSENSASSVARDKETISLSRLSRKMSSPPGYPLGNSRTSSPTKPIAPISSAKRRQSMELKFGSSRKQGNFPSDPQYSSPRHSTGWRSRLGSFLKKGALRKSKSDDSLLSSHNAREDRNGDKADVKSSEAVISLEPRTLYQNDGSKSTDAICVSAKDHPEARTLISSGNITKRSVPDNDQALVTKTEPRSHKLFSSLDSDFPGVIMDESGLGFNPLQFSPVFLSDTGFNLSDTPDLSRSSEDSMNEFIPDTKSAPGATSTVNCGNPDDELLSKSIYCSDQIKITEQTEQSVSNSEIDTYLNACNVNTASIKSEVKNASVKMKIITPLERLGNVSGDVLNRHAESNSNNNNQGEILATLVGVNGGATKHSCGWKTEEVDGSSGLTKVSREVRKKSTTTRTAMRDLPQTSGYLVQYASSHRNLNGKVQRSIAATFVQDRPVDSRLHRPHSIKRCMDVPPTDLARASGNRLSGGHNVRQHHSMRDITKRRRAYAAWVTRHRTEAKLAQPRISGCSRSLSAAEKSDLEKRPTPVPRSRSFKPVPMPRRSRCDSDKEKCIAKHNEIHGPPQIRSHAVSVLVD